jgi:hypothetical protein
MYIDDLKKNLSVTTRMAITTPFMLQGNNNVIIIDSTTSKSSD